MNFSKKSALMAALLFVVSGSAAQAAFVLPSWARLGANTTYQGWDVFTSPAGPNAPNTPTPAIVDAAPFNTYGTANVTESSGTSFVTSGGNIYSPTSAITVQTTIPNPGLGAGYYTEFLLQFRTQGNEFDFSTLTINGVAANTLPGFLVTELIRTPLGGFGGNLVDTAVTVAVPGNASLYTIGFASAASSTSFDRLSVDTATLVGAVPVPEPASLALVGLGAVALMARRRKA